MYTDCHPLSLHDALPIFVNQQTTLRKIKSLQHTVYQQTEEGFQARVQFISLVYKHGLQDKVRGDGSMLSRQFDTCFECNDADRVGGEVVRNARKDNFLDGIKADFTEHSYNMWSEDRKRKRRNSSHQ